MGDIFEANHIEEVFFNISILQYEYSSLYKAMPNNIEKCYLMIHKDICICIYIGIYSYIGNRNLRKL